jgi:hypothetical protein
MKNNMEKRKKTKKKTKRIFFLKMGPFYNPLDLGLEVMPTFKILSTIFSSN